MQDIHRILSVFHMSALLNMTSSPRHACTLKFKGIEGKLGEDLVLTELLTHLPLKTSSVQEIPLLSYERQQSCREIHFCPSDGGNC